MLLKKTRLFRCVHPPSLCHAATARPGQHPGAGRALSADITRLLGQQHQSKKINKNCAQRMNSRFKTPEKTALCAGCIIFCLLLQILQG
jgi:hypothetical protein